MASFQINNNQPQTISGNKIGSWPPTSWGTNRETALSNFFLPKLFDLRKTHLMFKISSGSLTSDF